MDQVKHLTLALFILFAPSLCVVGCGPSAEPQPMTEDLGPNAPDMMAPPVSRIRIDPSGAMFDHELGDIEVDWALTEACVKALFPVEPMFAVCDSAGRVYHYTRQGLTAVYRYGRVSTAADPFCAGKTTNRLARMSVLDSHEKSLIPGPHPCGGSGSLAPSLYDRQWYLTSAADVMPATAEDLIGVGPG